MATLPALIGLDRGGQVVTKADMCSLFSSSQLIHSFCTPNFAVVIKLSWEYAHLPGAFKNISLLKFGGGGGGGGEGKKTERKFMQG